MLPLLCFCEWCLIFAAATCIRERPTVIVAESSSGGENATFAADGDLHTTWKASSNANEWITLDYGVTREVAGLRIQVQNQAEQLPSRRAPGPLQREFGVGRCVSRGVSRGMSRVFPEKSFYGLLVSRCGSYNRITLHVSKKIDTIIPLRTWAPCSNILSASWIFRLNQKFSYRVWFRTK